MTIPTANEVFEAIGFSLGNFRRRLPEAMTIKRWVFMAAIAITGGVGVYAVGLPSISATGAWILFTLGIFLLGASAFCYVLFSFLMTLSQVSPQVQQDLRHIIRRAAHPLKTAAEISTQPSTDGAFTPYDEDRGYLQEQFEELVKAGILNPTDNIDEVLGENKDFDFDAIKAKAKGE